jgi:hypothetical protein
MIASVPALAIFVSVTSLLLYVRTAAPSVLPGDSGELQFAPWGFWLAHPTGYPLYLLLGGIWQHVVQVGDPAFRMNLFSAFCSALAVGVAFVTFTTVTPSRAASVIAALTFAVSPLFWSQATRAEVYALNTLFVTVLTLFGVLWQRGGERKYALALALTFGLSLTHHRTTILILPAFAALFATRLATLHFDSVHTLRRALPLVALATLPLFLYAYIPLRAGSTPYATIDLSPAPPIVVFENSPRGWLAVVFGTGFSGEYGVDARTAAQLGALANQMLEQFDIIGLALVLFGFGVLVAQKSFSLAGFVFFGIVTFVLFNASYHIGDIADYYTPVYFFSCLPLAAGIGFLIERSKSLFALRMNMLPTIIMLACVAALPLQGLFANFFSRDASLQFTARTRWASILASNLPSNAILLSNDRDEITPLYYLQLVEKQAPNWLGLFPKIGPEASLDNVVALVRRVAASERPIYAIKPIPALALRYPIEEMENGIWRVYPVAPGPPQYPSVAALGNSVRVRGFSLAAGTPRAGQRITLKVQYVPSEQLTHDFSTSIQLLDSSGKKVAQGNDHIPGEAEYPSSKWRAGETIQDQFDIELDPNLRAGAYDVMLAFYDPASGTALGDLTPIGKIELVE